jgi:hypothetical protein
MQMYMRVSQKEAEMRRTPFVLAGITLLVGIAIAACAPAAPTAPPPPPSVPTAQPPVGGSANQPAAPVQAAPLCPNATSSQAPVAELQKIDCTNKIPYTNVLVPVGTKFEVLDKTGAFTCNDSGIQIKGKTVVTCYGTELQSFQLKLTGGASNGATLTTGTGQCQQGYGYDPAQQCCAPVASDAGSTTVKVDLGGCPLPRVPKP